MKRVLTKTPVTSSTEAGTGLTLSDVLSLISAVDLINIQDNDGEVVFDGKCSDFRATTNRRDLLSQPVDRIRGYKNIIIILMA